MEHTLVSRAEIGSAPASREMRAIFIIACAGLTFAAGAQAQDAVRACRQLKDDAERLKCYDRLDTSASNAPRGQRESKADAETGWVVNDEKSPLDDSPLVSAALTSGDGKATLLMRCKKPSCPLPRQWFHLLPRRPSLKSHPAPHPGKPRGWRITRSAWREPLLLPPFPLTPRHRRHPPLPRRRRKTRRLLPHEEPAANCSTKCCLPA